MSTGLANDPYQVLSEEVLAEVAVSHGACIRPVMAQVRDTLDGREQLVAIPCGSTQASRCPSCAEKARRLRMHQCREGWHLDEEPDADEAEASPTEADADPDWLPTTLDDSEWIDAEGPDDPEGEPQKSLEAGEEVGPEEQDEPDDARRTRSTRRRSDAVELPRVPMDARTVGREFRGKNGRRYRPSTFLTVTLPSYGPVHEDGTPINPQRYDYRRAALDALHFSKVIDRLIQNLRRCAGFKIQYFAAIEPQRRLAPHLHAALRGVMPRAIIRQAVVATYHQVWWPAHDTAVYVEHLPVWDEPSQRYVDPNTGEALTTWDQALNLLDIQMQLDPATQPAHVVRLGTQLDMQGLIAASGDADRRVRYLTKYLGKSMAEPMSEDEDLTPRQLAHIERLHEELRWLPCTPKCANWLRYGIQPKDAEEGLVPGQCKGKAHDREHMGCGGRRVLVSRQWTGKTLTEHRADRADVVREVLALAGVSADEHGTLSATQTTSSGQQRYEWRIVSHDHADSPSYKAVLASSINHAATWRGQYAQAKERAAPWIELLSAISQRKLAKTA